MTQRIIALLKYVLIFLRELWNANIAVVKLVLSPELKIRPGFISVPMTARTDFEVTTYANSMTLTPGTIAVHVPDDRHAIVLHAIDIGDDADAVRRSCTEVLEHNILKWTRDGFVPPSTGPGSTSPNPTPVSAPSAPTDLHAGDSI